MPLLHVAECAQHVHDAEHRDPEAGRTAGVLGDLGDDDADGREHDSDQRGRDADGHRVRDLEPSADHHQRAEEADHQVGDQHRGERRCGRCMAPDDACTNELRAPGLLLGSGVADDLHDIEDRERDRDPPDELVGEHRPDRVVVQAVARAGHHRADRRLHEGGPRLALLERRVQGGERVDEVQVERHDRDSPHREAYTVAAQHEAKEVTGAGEGHARTPGDHGGRG